MNKITMFIEAYNKEIELHRIEVQQMIIQGINNDFKQGKITKELRDALPEVFNYFKRCSAAISEEKKQTVEDIAHEC